jgi:hypothetical protein
MTKIMHDDGAMSGRDVFFSVANLSYQVILLYNKNNLSTEIALLQILIFYAN